MYSAERKQQKHPVFLCSSAVLIANTNIIYFQSYVFLLCYAFWGYIGQTSLVSKSSIHVDDMNLDVFSSLFVLGKAIANDLSSDQSYM